MSTQIPPAGSGLNGLQDASVGDTVVPAVETRALWTGKIVIPIAGEWLSSNNVCRDNVAQGRRIKKLRKNAYDAAMATRPKLPINLEKILVDVLYLWGVAPVEECANLSNTLKACVDGAIGRKHGNAPGYGIVAADSDRHVKYGTVEGRQMPLTRGQVPIAKQLGQVVLTITELPSDSKTATGRKAVAGC